MEFFFKYLKVLTTKIQEKTLAPFSFDLIQLAHVSEEELPQIKKEVENIELIHCDAFWELTEEIYKSLILSTIKPSLQSYFQEIILLEKDNIDIKYQLHPWHSFELKSSAGEAVLAIQARYAEEQIQSFLNYLEIKDTNWKEDLYDFDYKFNFESEVEALFRNIAFECWKEASQQIGNKISACLSENNGGSHMYDLNTGEVSN